MESARPRGRPNVVEKDSDQTNISKVIERFVRFDKYARKMLWTIKNGEN